MKIKTATEAQKPGAEDGTPREYVRNCPPEPGDGDLKLVNGRWVWADDRPEPKDACGPLTDEEIEEMRMAEAGWEQLHVWQEGTYEGLFDD